MKFRVLGPLEVLGTTGRLSFAPRQRTILSMLLLESNRTVTVDRLVDAVWDVNPPSTAKEQIQICISIVRTTLSQGGFPDAIERRGPGYSILCTDDQLDLLAFERFLASGRKAMARREPTKAADEFRQGLDLWRGEPLDGVNSRLVESSRIPLVERRMVLIEEYTNARLQLHDPHEIIGELAQLVTANPFRERLRAQLMVALHQAGRRAEALEVYRTGRRLLIEELGLEPGEELLDAQRTILNGDGMHRAAEHTEVAIPMLLPPATRDFVGRAGLVNKIGRTLKRDVGRGTSVSIVALVGRVGIGKTALAVHAAHSLSDMFPDGQLFANLTAISGQDSVADVLGRFLRALGMVEHAIPFGVEERAEIYRSRTAGRRVLVVLDGAADPDVLKPLLPGSSSCAVILTCRGHRVVPTGTRRVEVGPLPTREAAELITEILNEHQVPARWPDMFRLAEICAGEPHALRLAAAWLTARPHRSVSSLVPALIDHGGGLTELITTDTDWLATIYRQLRPAARRLARGLGLLGVRTFASRICPLLLDADPDEVDELLAELVNAGVLDVHRIAGDSAVFRLSALFGAYAKAYLRDEESGE